MLCIRVSLPNIDVDYLKENYEKKDMCEWSGPGSEWTFMIKILKEKLTRKPKVWHHNIQTEMTLPKTFLKWHSMFQDCKFYQRFWYVFCGIAGEQIGIRVGLWCSHHIMLNSLALFYKLETSNGSGEFNFFLYKTLQEQNKAKICSRINDLQFSITFTNVQPELLDSSADDSALSTFNQLVR